MRTFRSNRIMGTGTVNAKGKTRLEGYGSIVKTKHLAEERNETSADVRKATMKIVGLGFYELSINRQKDYGCRFRPLWSDYDKTVFYNTYDVTALLKKGPEPTFGIAGNGFYNEQGGRYTKMKVSYGPPTLYCSARNRTEEWQNRLHRQR